MKMTEELIEGRLRLHIANVALAAVGKRDGALKDAKNALIREVVRIAYDAPNPHLAKADHS